MTYFDEFIDQLLTEERVCDVILPRLTKREVLEDTEGLAPRQSLLVSDVLPYVSLPCEAKTDRSVLLKQEEQDDEDQARRKRRRFSKSPDRRSNSPSDLLAKEDPDDEDYDAYDTGSRRGRSISRTPSADYASAGYISRDGSVSTDREGGEERGQVGYRSRSPSAGSERSYKSRDRSVSADRE